MTNALSLAARLFRMPPGLTQRIWALRQRVTGRPLRPAAAANSGTLAFLAGTRCDVIAEIGVEWGSTSEGILRHLNGRGELHLFDYEDRLAVVARRLRSLGFENFVEHGNSRKTLDSYNWSLMRLLESHAEPMFDYVFIDGGHSWPLDALAFLLADRLLKPGGYVDFDDYDWTFAQSPTMNPRAYPAVRKSFTREQLETPQIERVVELLVRRMNYEEIVPNKIFRKKLAG